MLYHSGMKKIKLTPVLVRIRPEAKALLVRASLEQRRSQASIVEFLVMEHLSRYKTTDQRLAAFLGDKDD
jgi:hypothetical protein|tara:strand:- start:161 stop:370 length:210 start_codon:yes stop_codon:yes gene_type:complete